ncbi:MAG TPA: universal stress protein [Gaiellaceae bacterium]|nr:universal stress protein [Gaiellaceae bacterium]
MSRRRRQQRLERVLGTPALFATAYGNVGSSIYYALGVVAVYALGLTPIVFIIAGIIFACTAATYTEGTVHYPEAGGSSSFARHAFNELVSFEAAWAQMLNYIATIAVSAFFVPHYLSVFWPPLRQNPWDIVFGIVVIALLVLLNIVGIQESARVNIFLAVADFATQLLLVLLGFVLVFSPQVLKANIHLGVAPTWSSFFLSIPIAMLAYTGIETVSNLSEEARDPLRTIPRAVLFVAIAVFAIYFTLPWVALSAMPVQHIAGDGYKTLLALPPTEHLHGQHGYQNDPVLGLVNNLGLNDALTHVLQIYLGILASTILFIGANAGVIGASRITYAMSGYRQLPMAFRKIHPRFKTPWLALVVFAGAIPIVLTLSGKTSFLGAIYSFGATFSFTVAHAAIVRMRMQQARGGVEIPYRSRFNLRVRGVDWPLFAIIGGLGTGLSFLVIVLQTPSIRYAGLGWLLIGFLFYVVYRRRVIHAPLTETVRAPIPLGPAVALEYRSVLVPVVWQRESEAAVDLACRLAVERRGSIVALTVIEVPLELPLDARLPGNVEERANDLLDEARAIGDAYGVNVIGRIVRARRAGRAIVDEAARRGSEIIVMGAPRREGRAPRGRIFGGTVDFVLKNAPCRVMVAAAPRAA